MDEEKYYKEECQKLYDKYEAESFKRIDDSNNLLNLLTTAVKIVLMVCIFNKIDELHLLLNNWLLVSIFIFGSLAIAASFLELFMDAEVNTEAIQGFHDYYLGDLEEQIEKRTLDAPLKYTRLFKVFCSMVFLCLFMVVVSYYIFNYVVLFGLQ